MQGKRLVRSRNDRMIAGVAGGLAALFNIDPLLVRIAFLVLAFMNGFGVMLYLALWLIGLGIEVIWNPPRCPQANGVVERSQGTGKRWAEPEAPGREGSTPDEPR